MSLFRASPLFRRRRRAGWLIQRPGRSTTSCRRRARDARNPVHGEGLPMHILVGSPRPFREREGKLPRRGRRPPAARAASSAGGHAAAAPARTIRANRPKLPPPAGGAGELSAARAKRRMRAMLRSSAARRPARPGSASRLPRRQGTDMDAGKIAILQRLSTRGLGGGFVRTSAGAMTGIVERHVRFAERHAVRAKLLRKGPPLSAKDDAEVMSRSERRGGSARSAPLAARSALAAQPIARAAAG